MPLPVVLLALLAQAPSWDSVPPISLKGIDLYWNVGTKTNEADEEAARSKGMKTLDLLNTYLDWTHKHREDINPREGNPWLKPPYFASTVAQHLAMKTKTAVLDIEVDFKDPKGGLLARQPGSPRLAEPEWTQQYVQEVASWYIEPLQRLKAANPGIKTGIYGLQPFGRNYWDVKKGPQASDRANAFNLKVWQAVDPYLDFYPVSIYTFYERPDSIYYWAANLEENARLAKLRGNKPIMAYEWLRYHEGKTQEAGKPLAPYLVEAYAVTPYFCGANSVVIWDSMWKQAGQPYQYLPLFMYSLKRLEKFAPAISSAQRNPADMPAWIAWQKHLPLVRRLKLAENDWLVLVIDPWQDDSASGDVPVSAGAFSGPLRTQGKYSEIYHVVGRKAFRVSFPGPPRP